MLFNSIYMKSPEEVNPRDKSRLMVIRGCREGGIWRAALDKYGFLSEMMKRFWN